jgi:hypothetical protein
VKRHREQRKSDTQMATENLTTSGTTQALVATSLSATPAGTNTEAIRAWADGNRTVIHATNNNTAGWPAILARNYATGADCIGISAQADGGTNTTGVVGIAPNGTRGVYGEAATYGVYGTGGTGVYGSGSSAGVIGVGSIGVIGEGNTGVYAAGSTWAGYFLGEGYFSRADQGRRRLPHRSPPRSCEKDPHALVRRVSRHEEHLRRSRDCRRRRRTLHRDAKLLRGTQHGPPVPVDRDRRLSSRSAHQAKADAGTLVRSAVPRLDKRFPGR